MKLGLPVLVLGGVSIILLLLLQQQWSPTFKILMHLQNIILKVTEQMESIFNEFQLDDKPSHLFTKLISIKQTHRLIQQTLIPGIASIQSQQNSPYKYQTFNIQQQLTPEETNTLENQLIQLKMRRARQIVQIHFQTAKPTHLILSSIQHQIDTEIDHLIYKLKNKINSIESSQNRSLNIKKDLDSTLGVFSKTPSLKARCQVEKCLGTIRQFEIEENYQLQSSKHQSQFTLGNKNVDASTIKKQTSNGSSSKIQFKSGFKSGFKSQKGLKKQKNASVSQFNIETKQSSSKRIKQRIMKIK